MLTTSVGMLKRLNLQKSPEAWESFVNLYGPLIYRWNLKAGLSAEDAKDVRKCFCRFLKACILLKGVPAAVSGPG